MKPCTECGGCGSFLRDCFDPMRGEHWTEEPECDHCDGSGDEPEVLTEADWDAFFDGGDR